MEQGEQLTDGELLRIAESLKANPGEKIPDYLSSDDKKTVKELLDILYARDKAVKLYLCKISYLDALKKAQDLKAQQQAQRNEAARRYENYKGYATTAAKIRQASQKAIEYLNSEYMRATDGIQKAVFNLGNDLFLCLDSRPSKRKMTVKLSENPTVLEEEPASRYIRARVYREFGSDESPFGKKMGLEERERIQTYLKETNSPFAFKAFAVSAEAKDAAVDNLCADTEVLGNISKKLADEMDRRAKKQRKAAQSMQGKAYGFQTKEYYEAMADVPVKQERLRVACGWYIVAAVGDWITQFGQSLMNG